MIISTSDFGLNESEILNSVYYGEYGINYAILESIRTDQEIFDMIMESKCIRALRNSGKLSPIQEANLISLQEKSDNSIKQKAIKIIDTAIEKIKAAFKFVIDSLKDLISKVLSKINNNGEINGNDLKVVQYIQKNSDSDVLKTDSIYNNFFDLVWKYKDAMKDESDDKDYDAEDEILSVDMCMNVLLFGKNEIDHDSKLSRNAIKDKVFDSLFETGDVILDNDARKNLMEFINNYCNLILNWLRINESKILKYTMQLKREFAKVDSTSGIQFLLKLINKAGIALPAALNIYRSCVTEAIRIATNSLNGV